MTGPGVASDPVLVIGGAGRTGRRVAGRLVEQGRNVQVLSRHPLHGDGQDASGGVQHLRGDLTAMDPAVLDAVGGIVVSVEPPSDAAGAEALMHRGVAALARAAAARQVPVVLVSQIYITRPDAYPQMRAVIKARGRGEQALRASGTPYVIVRPGWLRDGPAAGVRLEQGDTGDGAVSRETVAEACVQALLTSAAFGRTFEIFDADAGAADEPGTAVDWAALFGVLIADRHTAHAR